MLVKELRNIQMMWKAIFVALKHFKWIMERYFTTKNAAQTNY